MTDTEQALWYRIRQKQIHGVQFNRQKPILNFIVDFYCAKAKLIIELDGGQHFEIEQQRQDIQRDRKLLEIGLFVLRFDNLQVLTETESVIEVISQTVIDRINSKIPPQPPFSKGGISEKF